VGLTTAALAPRGTDLPSDVVARVGGSVITKAEFDREASHTFVEDGALLNVPYDPPDHTACVAAKAAANPAPVGGETPSDERLQAECRDDFEGFMPAVMESLIRAEWIRQEARSRGITMSHAAVDRKLDEFLQREGAAKKQEYKQFLRNSGTTREELLADIRVDLLEEATQEATQEASKRSEQETAGHANSNLRRPVQPEHRDLSLVLTRTKARANEVEAALNGGARWSDVAKSHSIDASSRARGGKLSGVPPGELEKELDRAAFNARMGAVEGPVETQFGWYVFEVTKITAARRQGAEQAKRAIKQRLQAEQQQQALEEFNSQLSESYRPRTICADEFKVPNCGNAY
jgi:foldase protein PrsA